MIDLNLKISFQRSDLMPKQCWLCIRGKKFCFLPDPHNFQTLPLPGLFVLPLRDMRHKLIHCDRCQLLLYCISSRFYLSLFYIQFINIDFLLEVIIHMMKVVTVLRCWYSNLSYCIFPKYALNHLKVLPDENPYHWKQSLP